jgi:hypothetical protein
MKENLSRLDQAVPLVKLQPAIVTAVRLSEINRPRKTISAPVMFRPSQYVVEAVSII